MSISKASVLLKGIQKHMPKLNRILNQIAETNFETTAVKNYFPDSPKISIEYGLIEKAENVVVYVSDMEWDDVGDFNAIARISNPNDQQNYNIGEVKSIDSQNNIIISEKLVSIIGVNNLIIADTEDALLVCDRAQSQKIKKIYDKLPEQYK